eukprot:m.225866 g.225866  ORF g.225866 m.225866 type:complete len:118 (+) comp15962_c0_seq1:1375-1728(+)
MLTTARPPSATTTLSVCTAACKEHAIAIMYTAQVLHSKEVRNSLPWTAITPLVGIVEDLGRTAQPPPVFTKVTRQSGSRSATHSLVSAILMKLSESKFFLIRFANNLSHTFIYISPS